MYNDGISNYYYWYAFNTEGYGGIQLTSKAFAKDIAWFPYILAISAILFAFSTMISWSYYGLKSWTYLFGKSKPKKMYLN